MREIGEVFIVEVKDIFPNRENKHCVCISVSKNAFLVINTLHREIYDDFEISAKDYSFLKNQNRFVSCSKILYIQNDKIKTFSLGKLNYKDILKIIDKIQNSKILETSEKYKILTELYTFKLENS